VLKKRKKSKGTKGGEPKQVLSAIKVRVKKVCRIEKFHLKKGEGKKTVEASFLIVQVKQHRLN